MPDFNETAIPVFANGFRFRHDAVRDQWVVLGPERAIVPDAIAAEVLRLIDGQSPLATIIDTLATKFAAPRDNISTDVLALADELAVKGVLKYNTSPSGA